MNIIGKFKTLYELWKKFPNGGVEGDAALVDGVTFFWSKVLVNWARLIEVNPNHKNTEIDGDLIVREDLHVAGKLYAYDLDLPQKGLFESKEALTLKYPKGKKGDWAIVGKTAPFNIWKWDCELGWVDTGEPIDIHIDADAFIGREEYERMLAEGYVYGGHVGTSTIVEEPKRNTFFMVTEKGTYENLGGVTIEANGAYIVKCKLFNGEKTYSVERVVMFDDINTNYETRTMSQKGIHALVNGKTEIFSFSGTIEVAEEEIIKESYEGEGGAILYNKTNNKFIVRVQTDGTTKYYESSSKFPLANTSPIIGRLYLTDTYGGEKLYIGCKEGLVIVAKPSGELGEDTELTMSQKAITDALAEETELRENAFDELLRIIREFKGSANVIDVVKDMDALNSYDTTNVNDKDIVIVLNDGGFLRFMQYVGTFPQGWMLKASVENPYTKTLADETFLKISNLATTTGQGETTAMTQKAVTDLFNDSVAITDVSAVERILVSNIDDTQYDGSGEIVLALVSDVLRNVRGMLLLKQGNKYYSNATQYPSVGNAAVEGKLYRTKESLYVYYDVDGNPPVQPSYSNVMKISAPADGYGDDNEIPISQSAFTDEVEGLSSRLDTQEETYIEYLS